MSNFSKKTLDLLRHAGWKEDWKAAHLNEYQQILTDEGFELSDTVTQFLTRFGGLLVEHPHAQLPEETEHFHFEVIKAVEGIDPDWVKEDYSERVGKPLCIIGEAFNRYMVLAMSPDGQVYAGFDGTLVHVGQSGEDAIEALCTGRELEQVADDKLGDTVYLLNDFFGEKRIRETYRFLNEQGDEPIRYQWLEAEFANFIYRHYEETKWLKPRQISPDWFDLTFKAGGKQYAVNLEIDQPTQSCLKKMVNDWRVHHTPDQILGDSVLAIIGIHPKMDMPEADIKHYLINETKKEGVEMNKDHIKTTHIPDSDYAFTVSTL